MRYSVSTLMVLFLLALPFISNGEIRHVPSDYATIQDGIDAAQMGDTVLVEHGEYFENLVFHSAWPITVASHFWQDSSAHDIENTILRPDPNSSKNEVVFLVGDKSQLCGFTINGNDRCRGVRTVNSSVTLSYCTIVKGNGWPDGGGVAVHISSSRVYATPELVNCRIENCRSVSGAGISFLGNVHSTLKLDRCNIDSNDGAGIWHSPYETGTHSTNIELHNCVVSNNGVGLIQRGSTNSNVFIDSSAFKENSGGGVRCETDGCLEVTNSVFEANGNPDSSGGAIFKPVGSTTTAVIDSCIFDRNKAKTGSALYLGKADVTRRTAVEEALASPCESPSRVTNCTFARNQATSESGATVQFDANNGIDLQFNNNIIAMNKHDQPVFQREGEGIVNVTYTDIFDNSKVTGKSANWVGCVKSLENINGNFSENPMFCDPDSSNFAIDFSSPCAPNSTGGDLIGAIGPACPEITDTIPVDMTTAPTSEVR